MQESIEQYKQRMAFAARILSDPDWAHRVIHLVESNDTGDCACQSYPAQSLFAVQGLEHHKAHWLARHGIHTVEELGRYSIAEIVALEEGEAGCHIIEWWQDNLTSHLKPSPPWRQHGPEIKHCDTISTRAKNILRKHLGLSHLGQLEYLTAENLLGMYNFGHACLKEVRESMRKHGLRLKDESD